MSDPTREAAKTDEALRNEVTWTLMRNFIVMRGDTASQRAVYEQTAKEIIADVRAVFLASPPDWLTALVVIVHDELCGASEHETGCCNECLAVPPSLRAVAGIDTPS